MALVTTVTPTVSEDPHRPGIPDDGFGNLGGEIDLNEISDWGYLSSFAHPQHFDVTPDWSSGSFDMSDGTIYRFEPGESEKQRIHNVASVSGVSLASDATNYVFYTSNNEFEVHDADEPPSDQSILVATLDTSTNTVDTDVRGRSPIPAPFVQAVQTEASGFAPIVTTADADSIADNSAELSGILDSLGGASTVEVYIQYREAGSGNAWSETTHDPVQQTGTFNAVVDGLTAGTQYEFRATALNPNSGLVGFGIVKKFTTTNDGTTNPTVSTTSASNITASSADLGGDLTSLGSYSSVDVFAEYRSVDGSDQSSTGGQTVSATGTFTETANGLRSVTTYEFRAVARSSAGEVYGSWVEFSTSAGTGLNVTTDSAQDIGTNSADLYGTVTSFGGASSASTNFNYRIQGKSVWKQTQLETITTTLSFIDTADQLVSGTTYEYQARASTSTDSATGAIETFTTDVQTLDIVIDDFEDGGVSADNGWAYGNEPPNGVTTNSLAGTYSGYVDLSAGENADVIRADQAPSTDNLELFSILLASELQNGSSDRSMTIELEDSNGSLFARCFFLHNGDIAVGSSSNVVGSWSVDTGYIVKFHMLGDGTYDCTVETLSGTVVVDTNESIGGDETAFDKFRIQCLNGNGSQSYRVRCDNIEYDTQ